MAPDDPQAMVRHCQEAKETGVPLVFDPSFQVIAFDGDALREAADGADVVLVNDYELAVFRRRPASPRASSLDLAPHLGRDPGGEGEPHPGARRRRSIYVPGGAVRSEVQDPTGAGDAYRAGFVTGLLRGLDLGVCGRLGAVSAVYAVEQYGTQTHRFTREEFEARYREAFE